MSRKVSSEVSISRTLKGQHVYKPALKGEKAETFNREDKAVMTLIGDLLYHIDLSTKVTVQEKCQKETSRTVA